eukprot:TRINITY_DN963_c0_g1_i2.p1 TRINITY_DN963_c0_g1~~TRINITY_DN963_c0_g1_i2.p1  ORF type:complete len:138 (-),score=42.38 TRINITY_DN963_c0_g1_i2:76-489(-)
MARIFLFLLLALSLLYVSVNAAESNKLLVHVDDPATLDEAIANTHNWFVALGSNATNAQAALVFNGLGPVVLPAPGYFRNALDNLTKQYKVQVLVCNNALNGLQIPPSALPPFAKVVPASILTLTQLQAEGYAYVKP